MPYKSRERKAVYNRSYADTMYGPDADPVRRAARRLAARKWSQSPEGDRTRRDSYLRSHYGIRVWDYDRMLVDQGGVCAICCRRSSRKRLAVDHDARTGRVRGLLCDACNRAVGLLQDDARNAHAMASYLEVAEEHEKEVLGDRD